MNKKGRLWLGSEVAKMTKIDFMIFLSDKFLNDFRKFSKEVQIFSLFQSLNRVIHLASKSQKVIFSPLAHPPAVSLDHTTLDQFAR